MNFYLVQYDPVLCTIERYTALGTFRVKKEDIEKEKNSMKKLMHQIIITIRLF